ncbi:DUF2089 domain-containing protein [Candidatus Hydrogenedentota bacterium]
MNKRLLPVSCPSCEQTLKVRRFECSNCDTAVEGNFDLPTLARLTPEEQSFVLNLVKCGGSLKDLAKIYGVSYPTVRNRLDALIERLDGLQSQASDEEGS